MLSSDSLNNEQCCGQHMSITTMNSVSKILLQKMCRTCLYLPFISSPVTGHMYGEMSTSLPALLASAVNAGFAVSLSSLTSCDITQIFHYQISQYA